MALLTAGPGPIIMVDIYCAMISVCPRCMRILIARYFLCALFLLLAPLWRVCLWIFFLSFIGLSFRKEAGVVVEIVDPIY